MKKTKVPKLFVIILNYNGKNTLSDCLSSVFQSNYANTEVVVVDNNSTDGSFEQARLAYSRAHFIRNSENIGFAKGNNVGIRFALEKFADFVFILNNDAMLEKDTLTLLVQEAKKHGKPAAYSPLILAANNKDVWFAGGFINWKKMRTEHIFEKTSDDTYPSEYLSGCGMLVDKEIFKRIGLFDERFFLYYEDADFSFRAKKAGFELFIFPAVHMKHLERSNTENSEKLYWLVLSGLIFFNLHGTLIQKIWIFNYTLLRRIKNIANNLSAKTLASTQISKAFSDFKKIPF